MSKHACLLVAAPLVLSMFGCAPEKEPVKQETPSIISSHTSGQISRETVITVRFSRELVDSGKVRIEIERSPLSIKPGIEGTALWTDRRSLEFRPAERLEGGTVYRATLTFRGLDGIPERPAPYTFEFTAIEQTFDVSVLGLKSKSDTALRWQEMTGRIVFADAEYNDKVEQMLSALQEGRDLPVQWDHSENRRVHRFLVDSIQRMKEQSEVELAWDGNRIGVKDRSGKRVVEIPSISSFSVSSARAVPGDEQYVEIRFSDPLDPDQDLRGLIHSEDAGNLRFTIDGSIVRVYGSSRWSGARAFVVERGVRNIKGSPFGKRHTFSAVFEELKPRVRFAGKGVIIPTTGGLTVPIEVVNLRAVVVEAMQVFEDNVPQFLQVNNLAGDNHIKRVGRVVWKETVQLDLTDKDENRWVRCGLDISPLVESHPGGFYRLRLSFRRPHIIYECADSIVTPPGVDQHDLGNLNQEQESSYWDYWEETGLGMYDHREFWRRRKDPCHPAYYRDYWDHDITVSRNVLISDIGLIAKKGSGDEITVVATDIQSTRPASGIAVTILDYQQQPVAEGRTGADGMVSMKAAREPYLVVADDGRHEGYLRLDNGSVQTVSHFDVAGEKVTGGLKGFIYGERGVWRPGDSLFITFMLHDRENRLPENHPVSLELWNSRNQLVTTVRTSQSKNGCYAFRLPTEPSAPTGTWKARVRVGGATFEKSLRIEMVMPNRLKIRFDPARDIITPDNRTVGGLLSATWLHGAVARNLRTEMEVTLNPTPTRFKDYEEYCFDDPARSYNPETQSVFEGTLNEKGTTHVSAPVEAGGVSPGMLDAVFTTRVFEPGGAFSTDRFSIPYHPYRRYIGIRLPPGDKRRGMLRTDTTHIARLTAVDPEGNPVSTRVEIRMYKIDWRWWWDKSKESLAKYVSSRSYHALKKDTVDIQEGRGVWSFEIQHPSWGRYLIRATDLNGEHAAGDVAYIDWPGWAGRARKDIPGGATVLSFRADKEEYTVGETAIVTVPTSNTGRGLLSIESGSRVLKAAWFEADSGETQYKIPLTAQMTPNVFVHVTFLQPHSRTANDLPIRMYGVIPIKVVDPATRIKPEIESAGVFRPRETERIKIREQSGRPMTYTVAVVDEGLLDLTRYATPDPWSHFFKHEALGVRTWDLFDLVAGAYGAELERMLAVGGGEALVDKGTKRGNRFPPMVQFMGPFTLRKGKTATHDIAIPQYVGSVRIMVVARDKGSFGHAEKQVYVRKPLMVLGTLPRVLGPEEEVQLPISVFALEKKVKKVAVKVAVDDALEVVGDHRKTITFSQPGDKLVRFALKVGGSPGWTRVNIQAAGGGEKATQSIDINVRMPGERVVDVVEATLQKGETWNREVTFPGVRGTNAATLEVSRIPPLNLEKRLRFLIRYPYGCVEQTVSSVFPQLYLTKLMDLPPGTAREIENNVKTGIERLRTHQTSDGGFGYWPGDNRAQAWCTNYAGHFLIEARRAGYTVPGMMINQWKKFQRRTAGSWTPGPERSELIQAYRLYTLALAGSSKLGAMNRLRESKHLSNDAQWRLAAAYQQAGHPETAAKIARSASLSVKHYRELRTTYGSSLRDKAMILEALALMRQLDKAKNLAKEISKQLCSDSWHSTQTTAYALIAMARFVGVAGDAGVMEYSVAWRGEKADDFSSSQPIVQTKLDCRDDTLVAVSVTNTGSVLIYPRVVVEGIPAPGTGKSAENDLSLDIAYETLEGKPLSIGKLAQGTNFIASVTVKNPGGRGRYDEVALSHIVPSGWEIHNERMSPLERAESSSFDYRDIRDDRVQTFFDIKENEEKTFRVLLNASYLGKFFLPMVTTEAMYDATINARVKGEWVEVVVAGAGQ